MECEGDVEGLPMRLCRISLSGIWRCVPVEVEFGESGAEGAQIPNLDLLIPFQGEQLGAIG